MRVLRRGPALVGCVVLCLLDCLRLAALRKLNPTRQSEVLERWSGRILSVAGVEVSVLGPIPANGLIASNHLSYLDILVFGAVARCAFVSKSEVRFWPLVGWIAAMTGTVFVDRSLRSQTYAVRPRMQERLRSGARLVLFPEATSSDGREILPFHSSLFEAAVATTAPIIASHISYELVARDGDPRLDIYYWGAMTLLPHAVKLLTKGGVRATVRFADHPQIFSDRKQAALEVHELVEELAEAEPKSPEQPAFTTSPGMARV